MPHITKQGQFPLKSYYNISTRCLQSHYGSYFNQSILLLTNQWVHIILFKLFSQKMTEYDFFYLK